MPSISGGKKSADHRGLSIALLIGAHFVYDTYRRNASKQIVFQRDGVLHFSKEVNKQTPARSFENLKQQGNEIRSLYFTHARGSKNIYLLLGRPHLEHIRRQMSLCSATQAGRYYTSTTI